MARVLNFGSLNIDHVYQVPHFVQPGETIHSSGYARHFGGKGLNQSIALARAGAPAAHAGCIGQDGLALRDFLQSNGVDTQSIRPVDSPTGHALIQVDDAGQNCIILYGGANRCLPEDMADQVLAPYAEGDYLLLQNEVNGLAHIMDRALARGMRVVLNPSPVLPPQHRLPLDRLHCLLVNEVEGASLSGTSQPDEILPALMALYPDTRIVMTLGREGAVYGFNGQRLFQPAFSVAAVDTTAAGDTFTGYFVDSLLRGMDAKAALARASAAAAIAVTRPGAAGSIPRSDEVDAFLSEQ